MIRSPSHSGYIFLVSVLAIGAIATATVVSLLLLGWAAEQNGYLVMQSRQANENARTCAERALRSLRSDVTYGGEQTFQLTRGSCTIDPIGGTGNENRTICVLGIDVNTDARMEVLVSKLYPSVVISSWQNVSDFSLCP
jgi:hypothetical protein